MAGLRTFLDSRFWHTGLLFLETAAVVGDNAVLQDNGCWERPVLLLETLLLREITVVFGSLPGRQAWNRLVWLLDCYLR